MLDDGGRVPCRPSQQNQSVVPTPFAQGIKRKKKNHGRRKERGGGYFGLFLFSGCAGKSSWRGVSLKMEKISSFILKLIF
jgi:hypothetical protein